jgi:hypothetical protein
VILEMGTRLAFPAGEEIRHLLQIAFHHIQVDQQRRSFNIRNVHAPFIDPSEHPTRFGASAATLRIPPWEVCRQIRLDGQRFVHIEATHQGLGALCALRRKVSFCCLLPGSSCFTAICRLER